jgi:integrase
VRKTLSDKGVAALKPRPKRYAHPDPELSGHYIRVTPSGAKSFAVVTRDPAGKQVWITFGPSDRMTIATARELARAAITRVRAGLPAVEAKTESFADIVANWRERHVEKNGLRSQSEIVRLLDRHVLPHWRHREFTAIKRSDIAALLDEVEDDHGARQADYCLNIVRSVMNWYAARTDNYNPPIVRGMRRQSPHAQARARVLADDEIGKVWKAAEANGTFGAIVRIALLTAQRRAKVVTMKWSDISPEGEWIIPQEPREKDSAGSLVLPPIALDVIRAQPCLGDNPFVFAGRGDRPVNGFSKLKRRFDARLSGVAPWTLHDLRRTARSLMSRAGVSSDHAERVMGHAIAGVEGVYDRHAYKGEKADALQRLAMLIDGIVHPRAANVTTLQKRMKSR